MTNPARRAYNGKIRASQKALGFHRVSVTLSHEEYALLAERAFQHDEPPTTHLKKCAFSYAADSYLVPPNLEERLGELTLILRGIGNNLNQLARHSNEMKYFLDTSEVRLQIRRMEEEVKNLVIHPRKG